MGHKHTIEYGVGRPTHSKSKRRAAFGNSLAWCLERQGFWDLTLLTCRHVPLNPRVSQARASPPARPLGTNSGTGPLQITICIRVSSTHLELYCSSELGPLRRSARAEHSVGCSSVPPSFGTALPGRRESRATIFEPADSRA